MPKDRQIHGIAQDQDPLGHVLTDSGDCRPSDQCQKREYVKWPSLGPRSPSQASSSSRPRWLIWRGQSTDLQTVFPLGPSDGPWEAWIRNTISSKSRSSTPVHYSPLRGMTIDAAVFDAFFDFNVYLVLPEVWGERLGVPGLRLPRTPVAPQAGVVGLTVYLPAARRRSGSAG